MVRVEVEKFLTDKDYVKLGNGSFVNENINYCIHISDSFDGEDDTDTSYYNQILNEQIENEKLYSFAKKSSILIILDNKLDKVKIRSDVFNFLKIFVEDLDAIPYKINKQIDVIFREGEEADYQTSYKTCDFYITPYWNFSENFINLMKFLNKIKGNAVVIFPRILTGSDDLYYMRYYTNKFYNTDTIYKE